MRDSEKEAEGKDWLTIGWTWLGWVDAECHNKDATS